MISKACGNLEQGLQIRQRNQKSMLLQPRHYQVSKEVVHKLEFGDAAVKQNINNLQFDFCLI